MASRKHALGVLLYRTLTASCAVCLPLSKLRTQLNTVLRAGALCPSTADIRQWISDHLAPSLHRTHAINICNYTFLYFAALFHVHRRLELVLTRQLFIRTCRTMSIWEWNAVLRLCYTVQIRSKDSQVKTQLILHIFILFKVTRWQHVSACITRPSLGHK